MMLCQIIVFCQQPLLNLVQPSCHHIKRCIPFELVDHVARDIIHVICLSMQLKSSTFFPGDFFLDQMTDETSSKDYAGKDTDPLNGQTPREGENVQKRY